MQEELDNAHRAMQDQLRKLNAMKTIAVRGKSAQKENKEQLAPIESEAKQKKAENSGPSKALDDSKAAIRKKPERRADAPNEEPPRRAERNQTKSFPSLKSSWRRKKRSLRMSTRQEQGRN